MSLARVIGSARGPVPATTFVPPAPARPAPVAAADAQAPRYVLQRYRGPAEFTDEPADPPRDIWRIHTFVGEEEYGLEAVVTDADRASLAGQDGDAWLDAEGELTDAVDRDTMGILLDMMNKNAETFGKHPRLTTRVRLA